MRIRLSARQRAELEHAHHTPGGALRPQAPHTTVAALVKLGYAMPAAYGQPARITRAGRAAVVGYERGAATWQRLTPTQRAALCALADGEATHVHTATLHQLDQAGFVDTPRYSGVAHIELTMAGREAVARIRGRLPDFTESEITTVCADELCVGDCVEEAGRRWIVELPSVRMVGLDHFIYDTYVHLRRDGDPPEKLHTFRMPAEHAFTRAQPRHE